jgi:hypothetical protein
MAWECQAVRAPVVKWTFPRDRGVGPWPEAIGSIETCPVNQFSGRSADGLAGSTFMVVSP